MSGSDIGAAPPAERRAWLQDLRRVDERQEDELAGDFDAQWGEIEPLHHSFVGRFLSRLPPDGRVLDAACGTGKYFPMVLASARRLLGVDHAGALLAVAAAKFPQVPTEQHDLQELPYRREFDGVLCVDAMEFVPPEDWPPVLERFRQVLRPRGWLYLTVELAPDSRVRAANQAARRSGLPVVDGEVIWEGPDGYYHHYPSMGQVRTWLAGAGFSIDEEAQGPWHQEDTPTTTCWPARRPCLGEKCAHSALRAFLRVVNFMDRPESLLGPAIALRVLGGNLRRAVTRPRGPATTRPAARVAHP